MSYRRNWSQLLPAPDLHWGQWERDARVPPVWNLRGGFIGIVLPISKIGLVPAGSYLNVKATPFRISISLRKHQNC